MNFEYTKQDSDFFDVIRNKLSVTSGIQDIRQLISVLKPTGYLEIDLVKDKKDFNMLTLIGAMEILANKCPEKFFPTETNLRLFGRIVANYGSLDQKQKWLEPILNGNMIGAVALCENTINAQSDRLITSGKKESDHMIINGEKNFVMHGSDFFAVIGMVGNSYAIFLIEKNTPGLFISNAISSVFDDMFKLDKITLTDCKIPMSQVIILPEINPIETLKLWENQIMIGACIGMMQASFDEAKEYANMHRSGGKPIIAYQEISFKLAEMLMLIHTSRLLALRAAWLYDTKDSETNIITNCAKVFCTESCEKLAGWALQILAAKGMEKGNKSEIAHRISKYAQIFGTSTEIARVKIGNSVLVSKG